MNRLVTLEKYNAILDKTKMIMNSWRENIHIAPGAVQEKMEKAQLERLIEMTEALKIWIDKEASITDGELILARINIGAIVESWLKFFYTVHYEDFLKEKKTDKRIKKKEPEKMNLNNLNRFSCDKLFKNNKDKMYIWVDKVRLKRNSVHFFEYKDIGGYNEFCEDIKELYEFINKIENQIYDLEEIIREYY